MINICSTVYDISDKTCGKAISVSSVANQDKDSNSRHIIMPVRLEFEGNGIEGAYAIVEATELMAAIENALNTYSGAGRVYRGYRNSSEF